LAPEASQRGPGYCEIIAKLTLSQPPDIRDTACGLFPDDGCFLFSPFFVLFLPFVVHVFTVFLVISDT
jgi:hypothetical protein